MLKTKSIRILKPWAHRRVKTGQFLFVLALLNASLPLPTAEATAGFAEWEVVTPGRNIIDGSDAIDDDKRPALCRGQFNPSSHRLDHDEIIIPRLRRWRYFNGIIAGESKNFYFLFTESNKEFVKFDSETELSSELERRKLAPMTDWITPGDAWRESWFLEFVWLPCRYLMTKRPSQKEYEEMKTQGYTEEQCKRDLAPEKLKVLLKTTVGESCKIMEENTPRSNEEAKRKQAIIKECHSMRDLAGN